jgi:hypothetical protein
VVGVVTLQRFDAELGCSLAEGATAATWRSRKSSWCEEVISPPTVCVELRGVTASHIVSIPRGPGTHDEASRPNSCASPMMIPSGPRM